ncbi:MAG: transcriptional regulator, partial [Gammaproteobacteria bacterium]
MTDHSGATAGELVAQTQRELEETADAIRSHRFLEHLRARDVPDERLRALAGEQHTIVSSDRRSFAQLAARFPAGHAGEFFLGMAESEGLALDKLRGLADWLSLTDDDLRAHEPHPGAQAYP